MALSQTMIRTFQDPSAGARRVTGETDYLFVTGAGTIFDPTGGKMSFANITDGTSNTLLMVEVKGSGINWAEPRDLDMSDVVPLPPGNQPRRSAASRRARSYMCRTAPIVMGGKGEEMGRSGKCC